MLTLPVDELRIMSIFASVGSHAHLFHEARSTDEVLTTSRILHPLLHLTVNNASEVGLVTDTTLVEADLGLSERHWIPEVIVTLCSKTWVLIKMLGPHDLHGFHLKIRA